MAEDLAPEDREIAGIVRALMDTGNMRPLVDLLRGGDGGPEGARDALALLGDLDLQLLVQIALDTLIDDHLDDPGLALQTRRVIRGDRSPATHAPLEPEA